MYNEYFGFKESPFAIAPDPRYLYMTAQHREALAHLVYGLNSEGGCILLTGEVGTGKTTICRCLLEQIPAEANVALVLNPKVNEIELLETICDELNIDYPDKNNPGTTNSIKTYTDRIYKFLIETHRKNESTVLIIDEAQNLDNTVLEQLRLLTNLETDQRKLLQIIILGQPELLDILAKTEMRQLAQRITARYHLEPLTKPSIKAYVDHRLAVAGQNIKIFPEKSINLLYKLSNGIPRLINVICDRALLGAYVENQYTVSPRILKKAAKEVFGELKNAEHGKNDNRWFFPASVIAGIAALSILLFFNFKQPITNISKKLLPVSANQTIEKGINTETIDEPAASTTIQAINNTNDSLPLLETGTNEIKNVSQSKKDNIISKSQGGIETTALLQDSTQQTVTQANNAKLINDFEASLNTPLNSIVMSYDKLFSLWGKKYNKNSGLSGCKQAEKLSLLCLHKQGNFNNLKTYNRPAVLKLITQEGNQRYVTVTKIQGNVATVYSNRISFVLPLSELDQYWHGQFSLLWNKPIEYTAPIKPGESGAIVGWLHSHLNIPGESDVRNIYTYALSRKVRAFQAENNLAADGIVGQITIIHLNSQSDKNIPTLIDK